MVYFVLLLTLSQIPSFLYHTYYPHPGAGSRAGYHAERGRRGLQGLSLLKQGRRLLSEVEARAGKDSGERGVVAVVAMVLVLAQRRHSRISDVGLPEVYILQQRTRLGHFHDGCV